VTCAVDYFHENPALPETATTTANIIYLLCSILKNDYYPITIHSADDRFNLLHLLLCSSSSAASFYPVEEKIGVVLSKFLNEESIKKTKIALKVNPVEMNLSNLEWKLVTIDKIQSTVLQSLEVTLKFVKAINDFLKNIVWPLASAFICQQNSKDEDRRSNLLRIMNYFSLPDNFKAGTELNIPPPSILNAQNFSKPAFYTEINSTVSQNLLANSKVAELENLLTVRKAILDGSDDNNMKETPSTMSDVKCKVPSNADKAEVKLQISHTPRLSPEYIPNSPKITNHEFKITDPIVKSSIFKQTKLASDDYTQNCKEDSAGSAPLCVAMNPNTKSQQYYPINSDTRVKALSLKVASKFSEIPKPLPVYPAIVQNNLYFNSLQELYQSNSYQIELYKQLLEQQETLDTLRAKLRSSRPDLQYASPACPKTSSSYISAPINSHNPILQENFPSSKSQNSQESSSSKN
jgi:hypothetical protein